MYVLHFPCSVMGFPRGHIQENKPYGAEDKRTL